VYLHSNTHMFWNRLHNDPSTSSKIDDFHTNQKPVWDFRLVFNSNLGPIFPRFSDIHVELHFFPYPTPIPVKISGCSLWRRSLMLESTERWKLTLIRHEIFEEFQPQRYRQTDGQTTCRSNIALCVAFRVKNLCRVKVKLLTSLYIFFTVYAYMTLIDLSSASAQSI